MKDIIKEFNMIDLLGMMFPGSILAGLACIEFHINDILEKVFGSIASGMLLAIILFGGYAAGMLLHEIADMVEKTLWETAYFNPQEYVIEKNDSSHLHEYGKKRGWMILGAPIGYIVLMALFISLPMLSQMFFSKYSWILYAIEIAIIIGNGIKVCYQKNRWDDSDVSKTEEKSSKISLFDGFRTMARNILILSFIIGFFSSLNGRSRILYIIDKAGISIFINPLVLKAIIFLVLLVFSIRYWHYSYLKERNLRFSPKDAESNESKAREENQNNQGDMYST